MKFKDMNMRQKRAAINVKYAAYFMLGGLENTLADNDEDTAEYKMAKEILSNHQLLVEELYERATSEVYGEGSMFFGDDAKRYLRDIRFCGKEWLMERCEKRITKEGY